MKRVLVVDDSRMIRDLLSYMVDSAGYDVETAGSGSEALDILARESFDIALVDLNMPLMDGYTLIRRIREEPTWTELPIVIITTEAEAQDRERGIEAGANLYMVKPVEEDELIGNIRLLIGDASE